VTNSTFLLWSSCTSFIFLSDLTLDNAVLEALEDEYAKNNYSNNGYELECYKPGCSITFTKEIF